MTSWQVYILKCSDGTLYTGVTTDIEQRIGTHNRGKGSRYTRGRRPVVLLWSEKADSKGKALHREAQIKKWSRTKKLELIKALTPSHLILDTTSRH